MKHLDVVPDLLPANAKDLADGELREVLAMKIGHPLKVAFSFRGVTFGSTHAKFLALISGNNHGNQRNNYRAAQFLPQGSIANDVAEIRAIATPIIINEPTGC
jgi:hypothetical protein